MWWRKKKVEGTPPTTLANVPSGPSPAYGGYGLSNSYMQAMTNLQQQNMKMLQQMANAYPSTYRGQSTYGGGYGWQGLSGWSGAYQNTLPASNLAILALQATLGTQERPQYDPYLEKATEFLENFLKTGQPSAWTGFLGIIEAAKTGDLTTLKGATAAAVLEKKKDG